MIRILLVDDQNLVQQGIKSLLEQDPILKVIGTVKDGRSAIKQIDILQPDIVLLDIEMPGMDGITATKYISRLSPKTKVIILSSHEDKKYLTQALMAGAKAYILKTSLIKDLRQAILAVEGGYSHIESRLLAKIFAPSNFKPRNTRSASSKGEVNRRSSQADKWQKFSSKQLAKNPETPHFEQSTVSLTPEQQSHKSGDNILSSTEVQNMAVDLPDSSIAKLHPIELTQINTDEEIEKISSSNLQQNTAHIDVVSRINRIQMQSDGNPDLSKKEPNSLIVVNKFLPATIIRRSASELSPMVNNSSFKISRKISRLLLKSKNYLRQVINQPRLVKYRNKAAFFCDSKLRQYQTMARLAKAKSKRYQSQLSPIIKEWDEKGWLANVGLVLLGAVIVVIIHQMFA
ncbi:MAG: response regulator transcription factor [Cyanobacteria bacterium P01_G01_bin.67]